MKEVGNLNDYKRGGLNTRLHSNKYESILENILKPEKNIKCEMCTELVFFKETNNELLFEIES